MLTASPTRRHNERPSASDSEPIRGTFGQNTQRPNNTSVAGSATSAKVAATTIPTAQAMPRPRVVGNTDSTRLSTPSTTVVALARTACDVRRNATRIASRRSSWVRSSSRYREISSSA